MTKSIQISTPAEANSLIDEAAEFNEQQKQAEPQAGTRINTGGAGRLEIKGGGAITKQRSDKASSAKVREPLQAGFVRLSNGMVADMESVRAADLTDSIVEVGGENPNREYQASPKVDAQEDDMGEEGQEDDGGGEKIQVENEDDAKKITVAGETLNRARGAIGTSAVEHMQQDAIASGRLPSLAELPEGFTQADTDNIVAGYTAQANAVLAGSGCNVDGLVSMLKETELREARKAVFVGCKRRSENPSLKRPNMSAAPE